MGSLKNKTILITGGTGSFGHEVLEKILKQDFREVRIFSRDELKQDVMRQELCQPKVKFYVGDVRDRASVDHVMKGVDLVFHAAALKQVPSCEFFPMQAVMTNIIGSNNVIESAVKNKVKNLVCLSTDKAVYPINAMGMTKALMEKNLQAHSRSLCAGDTTLCCVRYGNVMCSRGSVIPLFMKQIKAEKPITVTDPAMTRFLLPLPNAIDLVLFAFAHAAQGDIFIKKSPASTVEDLAVAMKNIFKSKVPVKVIGIRHGEKIYETLATAAELRKSEDFGDYFRIRMDDRDLNYDKYFSNGDKKVGEVEDYTSHNTQRLTVREIEKLLLSLPEVQKEL
jgi:UDP-glucose 4-epimerase